jgi:hypothetical protein
MALTDVELAAALCEQVYRRDSLDQQLEFSEGFAETLVARENRISGFTQDAGFYYNNATGFVGRIVETDGKIFIVFRGSDLSDNFSAALLPALFEYPAPGGAPSTVDAQDWSDNRKLGWTPQGVCAIIKATTASRRHYSASRQTASGLM